MVNLMYRFVVAVSLLILTSCAGADVQMGTVSSSKNDVTSLTPAHRVLYAQGTSFLKLNDQTADAPIAGMSITLPPLGKNTSNALVTFDGGTAGGQVCTFTVYANGSATPASAGLNATSTSEVLVYDVPLTSSKQLIQMYWHTTNPGYCQLSDFYSLSAVLTI